MILAIRRVRATRGASLETHFISLALFGSHATLVPHLIELGPCYKAVSRRGRSMVLLKPFFVLNPHGISVDRTDAKQSTGKPQAAR